MVDAITANIPYTVPTGETLVNESFGPKNIHGRRTGTVERKKMTVRNGRLFADRLSLDDQGLVFVDHKTQVTDFFDENQLKSVYYPEIEQLIRRESGASRVVIFDHALRSGDEAEREEKLIRTPVLQAHNDYTEWSGPNRLQEILPDEAESSAYATLRDHSGVAGDQSADTIESAGACRCQERCAGRLDGGGAPLPP